MNVVFVTRGALPRAGGIQAHQDAIARTLAAQGHAVTIYAARIDDEPFDRQNTILGAQRFPGFVRDGVKTEPFPLGAFERGALLPTAVTGLPGADRLLGYHRVRAMLLPLVVRHVGGCFRRAFAGASIVHAMGGEPQAHAALAAARALGIPFVVTPFAHPGFWGDDELNLRLYRDADAVVPLLPGEKAWLLESGVSPDRVHVIGVPAPEPPAEAGGAPSGMPFEESRGDAGRRRLVLCLGVKRRYKYKLLLEALPHVERRDVRFAFVGPESSEWHGDYVEATESDDRTLSAGKVDEREKWGWLAACDLLCLPSVSEIMPVSILEAWRMERPVVVARGRWTHDLVEDGRDGIIAEPRPQALAEAIEQVLADPTRARQMGEAGRAKVEEHYTAAVVSAAHEQLYETLVGAKG